MSRVLITGAGRSRGLAAACARVLAASGWEIGLGHWDVDAGEVRTLVGELGRGGARVAAAEADLRSPHAPAALFDELERAVGGPFDALIAAHCRDVELTLMDSSADELDLHFAVNARSVALLIQEFARRFQAGDGRIVAFTSDALEDNVPYGVSKAALDRVVIAAAQELGPRGIRANAVDPGPTETGWISEQLRSELTAQTPLGRTGLPSDGAHLVAFLLSPEGGWITGQVLRSDGGLG